MMIQRKPFLYIFSTDLHHALGEEPFKRLVDVDQAAILQRLGEEAGIEQVQDRVFNAAHVLLHR